LKTRLLYTAIFCLLLLPGAYAQLGANKEGGIAYEKEWSFGAMAHTNGFGGNLQFTRFRHKGNFSLLDINIYSIFHPKEISLPNPDNQGSRPYVFGKLNQLMAFNAGYGSRIVLADQYVPGNIRINFNYSLGPLIGMLKPVIYEIQSPDPLLPDKFEKFNPNDEVQQSRIIGSDWTRGFNQLTFLYGIHGKGSFSFEWGNREAHFFSLEAGCIIDAFPQEVPIFAYIKNQRVFTNLFLSFSFGKRS
jgi:hypothetical protein